MKCTVNFVQHLSPNRCVIEYVYEDCSIHERDFSAPPHGGYVWEDWPRRQVRERLARTGWALHWDPAKFPTLADLLRHEYRRAIGAARFQESQR